MAQPLRSTTTHRDGDDGGLQSPEALMISALVEEGNFDPAHWRIDDEDLACYNSLWAFCRDHQLRAGRSPSIELLKRSFPDFEITSDVDPNWAADRLRQAAAARRLRERMKVALDHLRDDDTEQAYQALDGLMVPIRARAAPHEGFDHELDTEEYDEEGLHVPYDVLGRATGGIKNGDVWLMGARLTQGKTTMACNYVAAAVKDAARVGYFSREMPSKQIRLKVNGCLAGRDQELQKLLHSDERSDRRKAVDKLAERMPGTFAVYDPTHGPCDPSVIRDALAEFDLVVVDHVELMTLRGKPLVGDWQLQSEASVKLKEENLRANARLLEIIQVNRQGESIQRQRVPKLSESSGCDQWARDCDIGVMMNRFSTSVMVHNAEKVRLGPSVRWYSRYDPVASRYEQISYDMANDLMVRDEDQAERANR